MPTPIKECPCKSLFSKPKNMFNTAEIILLLKNKLNLKDPFERRESNCLMSYTIMKAMIHFRNRLLICMSLITSTGNFDIFNLQFLTAFILV